MTTATTSTSPLSKIKHFLGIVWSGVVKTEAVLEKDTPGIEADLSLAADVTSLLNPAAGAIAKEIVTGGFTALGAFTEALQASTVTATELLTEAPEFTQVTIRTEALAQVAALLEKYKADFEDIKNSFVEQAEGKTTTTAAAAPAETASTVVKSS
jgi:hypothetical protein